MKDICALDLNPIPSAIDVLPRVDVKSVVERKEGLASSFSTSRLLQTPFVKRTIKESRQLDSIRGIAVNKSSMSTGR